MHVLANIFVYVKGDTYSLILFKFTGFLQKWSEYPAHNMFHQRYLPYTWSAQHMSDFHTV